MRPRATATRATAARRGSVCRPSPEVKVACMQSAVHVSAPMRSGKPLITVRENAKRAAGGRTKRAQTDAVGETIGALPERTRARFLIEPDLGIGFRPDYRVLVGEAETICEVKNHLRGQGVREQLAHKP